MLQAIRGSCLLGRENGSQEGQIRTRCHCQSDSQGGAMQENILDGLDG